MKDETVSNFEKSVDSTSTLEFLMAKLKSIEQIVELGLYYSFEKNRSYRSFEKNGTCWIEINKLIKRAYDETRLAIDALSALQESKEINNE